MSQYYARIYVEARTEEAYNKLTKMDLTGTGLEEFRTAKELFDGGGKIFCINDEFSMYESELWTLCKGICKILDNDCVLIADTTNINVDPYNYVCFNLGDGYMQDKYLDGEAHHESNILDIEEWMRKNRIRKTNIRKEFLSDFGHDIETKKKKK